MAITNTWLQDYLVEQLEQTKVQYAQHIINVKPIPNPMYMVEDNQTETIWSKEDEETYTNLELRMSWLREQLQALEVTEKEHRMIDELKELIQSYEERYDAIQEEIADYQNDYDYESDPEGIDYDLHFVHQLTVDAEMVEQSIKHLEEELNELQKY
jgi:hypothetical protein